MLLMVISNSATTEQIEQSTLFGQQLSQVDANIEALSDRSLLPMR